MKKRNDYLVDLEKTVTIIKEFEYLLSVMRKTAIRAKLFDHDNKNIEDLEILKFTQPELQEYTLRIRESWEEMVRSIYAAYVEITGDFITITGPEESEDE